MDIHKYIFPAALAATVHVALLWFLPNEARTRLVEVPLITDEQGKGPEETPQPPEAQVVSTEPIAPLAGGPALPALPEPPVAAMKDTVSVGLDEPNKHLDHRLSVIPEILGPGGIGKVGEVGLGSAGLFTPGELDRLPSAQVQLPPEYPYSLKQSGTVGSVVVEFDVNAEGRVVRAVVLNYTDRGFVEPAVRAVRKWKFEPGRRRGQAVPFRMAVPIVFGIENN
jgi:protein TonB